MTTEPTTTPANSSMALEPMRNGERELRQNMVAGDSPAMAIIPKTFLELQSFADALAKSSLVPKAFQGHPANTFLAMGAGLELGFSPFAALRMFDVIEGKVGLNSKALGAIVMSKSHVCEYLEPDNDNDGTKATWRTKRKGRPEKSKTWTIEMAEKAGLTKKDNWKNYPHRMLSARARKDLCDDVYPEIVAGLPSTEELLDMVADTASSLGFSAPAAPASTAAPTLTVVPDEKPKTKAAKADKSKPIDTSSTETKEPTAKEAQAAATKATADDAFAKAAANARALDEERAKRNAEAAANPQTSTGGSSAPSTNSSPETAPASSAGSSEPGSSTSAGSQSASATDDDGFGGGDDVEPFEVVRVDPKLSPEENFARYEKNIATVRTATELEIVKNEWAPWSRVGQPGNVHAVRLREIFAAKKAGLGL